jgi:predicted nucleic acid-binding protein
MPTTLREGEKHSLAKSIVQGIWRESGGVVTLQNLCEFFVVVTRKVEHPIPFDEARSIIGDIISSTKWMVIDRDHESVIKGIDLAGQAGIHFWDALIAACMLENGISVIITENESDFKKTQGITVVNPFSASATL